jgi:hypothetical protein
MSDRCACKVMAELLMLAHERTCEAELADVFAAEIDAGRLSDLSALRAHFRPEETPIPSVAVGLVPLGASGSPGCGKSHLSAALGLALVEDGWRVLFARTTDLV